MQLKGLEIDRDVGQKDSQKSTDKKGTPSSVLSAAVWGHYPI